jgi:hypothetical protein
MEIKHLGSGVVVFDGAINIDKELIDGYIAHLRETGATEVFTEQKDDDGNVTHALNPTGYEFDLEAVSMAPERYVQIYNERTPQKYKDFLQECEDVFYKCMVEYCKIFPVALESIWWRTRGHVATYRNGQNIGPHSDTAIPHVFGEKPVNQFPLHNTVTATLGFNEEFEGGEVHFRAWDITVPAKTGRIIMYPSNYMGTHEVFPVTSGERYVYLSWFCFGDTGMPLPPISEQGLEQMWKWLPNLKNDVGSENMFAKKAEVQKL